MCSETSHSKKLMIKLFLSFVNLKVTYIFIYSEAEVVPDHDQHYKFLEVRGREAVVIDELISCSII